MEQKEGYKTIYKRLHSGRPPKLQDGITLDGLRVEREIADKITAGCQAAGIPEADYRRHILDRWFADKKNRIHD